MNGPKLENVLHYSCFNLLEVHDALHLQCGDFFVKVVPRARRCPFVLILYLLWRSWVRPPTPCLPKNTKLQSIVVFLLILFACKIRSALMMTKMVYFSTNKILLRNIFINNAKVCSCSIIQPADGCFSYRSPVKYVFSHLNYKKL